MRTQEEHNKLIEKLIEKHLSPEMKEWFEDVKDKAIEINYEDTNGVKTKAIMSADPYIGISIVLEEDTEECLATMAGPLTMDLELREYFFGIHRSEEWLERKIEEQCVDSYPEAKKMAEDKLYSEISNMTSSGSKPICSFTG